MTTPGNDAQASGLAPMHSADHGGKTEVVTALDRIHILYTRLGIDEVLLDYAMEAPGSNADGIDVEALLDSYAAGVAELALGNDGAIDVGLIHDAFERLTVGYNQAAAEKFGPVDPRTRRERALIKAGFRQPVYREVFKTVGHRHEGEPDRYPYWGRQFMEQYESGAITPRAEGETDQSYLARYIRACIHGFSWANFSDIRGATRFA